MLWAQRSRAQAWLAGDARLHCAGGLQRLHAAGVRSGHHHGHEKRSHRLPSPAKQQNSMVIIFCLLVPRGSGRAGLARPPWWRAGHGRQSVKQRTAGGGAGRGRRSATGAARGVAGPRSPSGASRAGPDSRYSGHERRRGFRRHRGGIRGRLADAPLARRRERPAGRAPCSRRCRPCDMEGPAVVRRSRNPRLGSCRLMDPQPLNAGRR